MELRIFLRLFSLLCFCGKSFGAKILILHPIYSGSHVLTLRSVAESLAQRGHSIHIIRWKDQHSFPAISNVNITVTTLAMDNSYGRWNYLTKEKRAAFMMPFDILWNSGLTFKSVLEAGGEAFPLLGTQCETLLGNKQLYNTLRRERFDLAIVDILYNECGLALLHQLKVPAIGYWAFPFSSGEADYTTAFLPASHVPAFMAKLGDEMNFLERTFNVFMKMGSHVCMLIHCYIVNRAVQKYYPGSPHPFDLLKNLNGMLINTDYAMDYPRLLPPTFINVGGMQIRTPKPLPKEIDDWVESSGEHGVVLFTMGFIFNPKVVPKKLVNAFMEAFSRLPQKFLVKFEGAIDHIPSNVKVLEWVPQQDVLAHPKTKAFLTHCGLHGVMEAVYYGVPMVGMPIFIDQGDALIKMKEKQIAVGFNKDTATAEEIYQSLKEVLTNPKYKKNIDKLSVLMRDVKETPLERVIEFTEYMVRHKGAEHLKLGSRNLNVIQYFCIDTIAFILLLLFSVVYIQYKFATFIFRKCASSNNEIVADNNSQVNSSSSLINKDSLGMGMKAIVDDEIDSTTNVISFAGNIAPFANSISSLQDKKRI